MRLTTLLLTAVLAATFATTADAAKRKTVTVDQGVAAQEQSAMFWRDAFQPWTTSLDAPGAKRAHKAKMKKSKKA
jgi:hypothetical protein